jgi:hypothetical protein
MRKMGRLWILSLAPLFLLSIEAHAQSLSGALTGTVKDSQGGVLGGAVVRITSPALMGGERQDVSNEKGQWRFPVLPSGEYVLNVEATPKFAPFRREGLTIGAGDTLELAIVLQLAGVSVSVDVEASALNSRATGLETRFGQDYIRTVPTRRYSMFDLIRSTPGVSPSSPSSGTVNTVSVFGSAVNENAFLIDGTNFTCPCQGVSRAEPIVDVIQELHVQSMGASVEFGNIQGGVFNVVTKQGGARFAGQASYYGQPASLTAQPIILPVTGGSPSGYERVKYQDLTGSVGGPVKRDRLWFFGAIQYLRDYDSQPGVDPTKPRKYEQNKFFGKLNWRLTPNLQLMQSFHQENWVNPTPPTIATPFETTQRVHASVPNMTFAHLTHAVSNRTVWEARVGRFTLDQDADPSSGDRTTPPRRDLVTGISSHNAADIRHLMLDRLTTKAVLHRYQPDWLGVDHELKTGVSVERGEHQLLQLIPGGVQYLDSNGNQSQAVYRAPSIAGGVFITSAVFASDSFTLQNRITVDAGLRFDHNRAVSQDLPVVDAEGRETGQFTEGLGTIYTQNVLSPRFGVNMRLDDNGRTMLRGNYGRFNQGILTGELDPISPGITPTTTMAWDGATGGYTTPVSVVDPKKNLAIDPDTRTPHTDEFSVALDREITSRVRTSVAYVGKRGTDYIGWTDTGGEYRSETRTLADGTVLPVFLLTNGTAARRFLLTNPEPFAVDYDALVLAVEKRLSTRWQASGSYTYSKTRGLLVTSNAAAAEPQFSTIARPSFLTFGQDPNDLTNATGRLPNDRPHIFRSTGIVHLPWQEILIAGNFQYFSGKPWAATTQVTLPQGTQRIMLETRGTRRLPSQSLLDVRIAKTFAISSATRIELILDALNLLNDTAAEAIASDNLSAQTFGRATQFMDPRRVMLGVRLNLGR